MRVNDWEADAPFRYLRFREPPYPTSSSRSSPRRIRPLLDEGIDVFAYFRHEDEPRRPVTRRGSSSSSGMNRPLRVVGRDARAIRLDFGALNLERVPAVPSTSLTVRDQSVGRCIYMATGTVKWFDDAKGYGFIAPEDGGKDLFVHHSGIGGEGFKSLSEGAKVEFEAREGQKGPEAFNVVAV